MSVMGQTESNREREPTLEASKLSHLCCAS